MKASKVKGAKGAASGKKAQKKGAKKTFPRGKKPDKEDDSDLEMAMEEEPEQAVNGHKKKAKKNAEEVPDFDDFVNDLNDDGDDDGLSAEDDDAEGSSSDDDDKGPNGKAFLSGLKNKDPEFYKFLQENDQELLNNMRQEEDNDEGESGDEDEEGAVHEAPDELEVASDDSEFEEDDDEEAPAKKAGKTKDASGLSHATLAKWEKQLGESPSSALLQQLTQALNGAIDGLAGESGGGKKNRPSSALFNAVIRLCLTKFEPAVRKVLRLESGTSEIKTFQLRRSKKWNSLNKTLKSYTSDLVRLLGLVGASSAQGALLKHVHQLLPYFSALPKSNKLLQQRLIGLWSSADDESVRILAYLCLVRLARSAAHAGAEGSAAFEQLVKQMYMTYVRHCKFTSPNTWPVINFMRRSLAELMALEPKTVYQPAFVYIRQLAITLRNAVTLQKQDTIQAVYNWQFVHSVHLWTQLLSSCRSQALEPLIYPLVQVATGAVRLVYTSKYHPLRFHLSSMLTQLSEATGVFVPVLPFYLEVLQTHNFNKKTSKVSMRPVDFSCILRVSTSQALENGTKDTTMDHVYTGILAYLSGQAHRIAFPELVIPCVVQLKDFVKRCKVANYCKKARQLADKIEENSRHIARARRGVSFGVGDKTLIGRWETATKTEGTPLAKFYASWSKVKEGQEMKRITEQEKIGDYDFIPDMSQMRKKKAQKAEEAKDAKTAEEEFKGLFDDDEEDSDEDLEERFTLKEERGKKRKAAEAEAAEAEMQEEVEEEEEAQELSKKQKKKAKKAKKLAQRTSAVADEDDQVTDLNLDDF